MIMFAGLDWLWYALTLAGVFAAGAVPFWMHGRAAAADAYADGWTDRESFRLGRHARKLPGGVVEVDEEYSDPCPECGSLLAYSHCDGCTLDPAPTREWAEITADWMAPEARAELAAWVQEMTLRAA